MKLQRMLINMLSFNKLAHQLCFMFVYNGLNTLCGVFILHLLRTARGCCMHVFSSNNNQTKAILGLVISSVVTPNVGLTNVSLFEPSISSIVGQQAGICCDFHGLKNFDLDMINQKLVYQEYFLHKFHEDPLKMVAREHKYSKLLLLVYVKLR